MSKRWASTRVLIWRSVNGGIKSALKPLTPQKQGGNISKPKHDPKSTFVQIERCYNKMLDFKKKYLHRNVKVVYDVC